MKKFFFSLIFLGLVFSAGFFIGSRYQDKGYLFPEKKILSSKEYPIKENKQFIILLTSNEHSLERSLRSIAEQDYPYFRVVYISSSEENGFLQFAKTLGLEDKVRFVQSSAGEDVLCLYKTIHESADNEIVVHLSDGSWFSHEGALSRLNSEFQNPDVWVTASSFIDYPSFTKIRPSNLGKNIRSKRLITDFSYYAALGKRIKLSDLFYHGKILDSYYPEAVYYPLLEMAKSKCSSIQEALYCKSPSDNSNLPKHKSLVKHLSSLPHYLEQSVLFATPQQHMVDFFVISDKNPMQLYAFLESLQKYVSGFYRVSVFYAGFETQYEKVKDAFVGAHFISVDESSFQKEFVQAFSDNSSDYILLAKGDTVVKSSIDLKECVEALEETGACGFYFTLDANVAPQTSLAKSIFAWDFEYGKGDFSYPHAAGMSLFRKAELKKTVSEKKFTNFSMLEYAFSEEMPQDSLGLYYDPSKAVRVTLQDTFSQTASSVEEELLEKFDEGMKINISAFEDALSGQSRPLEFMPR
jgi:hypothetical protein